MTTITVPSNEEFEVRPAGTYTSRFMDLKTVDKKPEWVTADEPDAKQFEWWFEMPANEESPAMTIRRWTSRKMGRGSKARETIEALIGRELVTGEEIVLEDLIDKKCRLVLSETKGDGTPGNRVLQALPLRTQRASIPPPIAQEPLFPGDDGSDIPFGVEEEATAGKGKQVAK